MTFLRRNRRALAALPVLALLAVLASGQRMVDLWWPGGMNDRVPTDDAGTAVFDVVLDLQSGVQRERVTVRHVMTGATDRMPLGDGTEVAVPQGFRALRVRVHVEADPEAVITTCQVLLVDEDGARYPAGTAMFDGGLTDLASCQPVDAVNPSGFDIDADRESTRPPAYDREAVFVLPADVDPVTVRVSPDLHHYADWSLAAGS